MTIFIASCGCMNLERKDLLKIKINGNYKLVCPIHKAEKKGRILFAINKCIDCKWSYYVSLHGYSSRKRDTECQKKYKIEYGKNRNRKKQAVDIREREQTAKKKNRNDRGNSVYHKPSDGAVPYKDIFATRPEYNERTKHGQRSFIR